MEMTNMEIQNTIGIPGLAYNLKSFKDQEDSDLNNQQMPKLAYN